MEMGRQLPFAGVVYMTVTMANLSSCPWEIAMVKLDLYSILFHGYISPQSLWHRWKEDEVPLYLRLNLLNIH